MLSNIEFIQQSLATHLFFARIMKEHSFFLQIGFTPRDISCTQQADAFRRAFDCLLEEVISLSNGVVSPDVLQSGEVFTQYTLSAEKLTVYYTGVRIPTNLTQAETQLMGMGRMLGNPSLEQRVCVVNEKAMGLISKLIQFKSMILTNVLCCRMFTVNYPLLIDHIMREAKLYLLMIQRLQKREEMDIEKEAFEQETFWNRIMAEHSKFIRGLLDPTEEALISKANDFANEFDKLTEEAKAAMDKSMSIAGLTDDSLKATKDIRDFKAQGTEGLIECKIKSIIIPLLGDHTLREANHYLRLLNRFKTAEKS